MSSYSPARTQPESFKSSLLERSLAPLLMLRPSGRHAPATAHEGGVLLLSALAGPLAREEADDLGVVVRRVDVVGPAGGRDHVQQLGPPFQDLPCARVARQGEQLVPQLAGEDDGGRPPFVALRDGDRGP